MAARIGLGEPSTNQLWVTKLKYKFQNSRRRDETVRASLEVLQRKRKQPPIRNLSKTAKEQVKYPIFGMPNYLPARQASEDDKSIEANKQWLLTEGTKKRPNYEEVDVRMTLTFSDRRNEIIKENIPIAQLKEECPWLFKDDGIELLADFRRIHGSCGALQLLKKGLQTYARPLLLSYKGRCLRTKLKRDEDLLSFLDDIEKLADEKAREDAEAKAAITAIPALLGESNNIIIIIIGDGDQTGGLAIFVSTDESSPLHSREFSLVVDGTSVCRVGDLLTAAACYLSAFYVFHLQYESTLQRTLEFCQIALFQVKDKCPTDKHVLTFMTGLHRKMP
ncbi:sterile alpha motif domain-containing protein 3-like [Diadema antillarum]|uniref:sterile alpha motif domain-containing protein 3-like n=1 Tax=Diadema antillarum TaxID=105358 RepID=UPI003A86123A